MACTTTNFTREELANARKNLSIYSQPQLNQTQEETIAKLEAVDSVVEKKDEKYWLWDWMMKTRVSEQAKRKKHLAERSITADDDIKREGGTTIHDILRELVDWYAHDKGDLSAIKKKAFGSDVKLDNNHFQQLSQLANRTVNDIKKLQEQIDPKGKVEIRTEMFIGDFIKDVGGRLDILAVFSDNTGAIYDFKTSGRNDPIGYGEHGKVVTKNPLPYHDIDHYHIAMAEYKRILIERIGVKSIRHNRLLPIAVSYKYKKSEDQKEGSKLKSEIDTLIAIQKDDVLKPIPVGGEQSQWEGINKLVEKQYNQLEQLSKQIKNKALSEDEKERIKGRMASIEKSIGKTLVDGDIQDLLQTVRTLTVEVKTRLNELEMLSTNELNPAYLTMSDVETLKNEMDVYKDIIEETHTYFEDLKEKDLPKFNSLKEKLREIKPYFDEARTLLNIEYNNRAAELVSSDFKDENGNLLPLEELNFAQLKFLKISEINHPIFKAVWSIIEDAQYEIKKKYMDMDKNVHSKLDEVFKWANQNLSGGDKRSQAFKIMINEETGNLYSKLKPGFVKELNSKIEDKSLKSVKVVKDNYDFRDKEKWQKDYAVRLEAFKNIEKARYNNFEPTVDINGKTIKSGASQKKSYDLAVEQFINSNDLVNSNDAWLNKTNRRRFLKLKDSVVQANLSEEYKKIKSIKPIHDFYEMWNEYMEEFSEILGVYDYSKFPPNFIPNIRKEVIEHFSLDGLHVAAATREMMDSFSVREEDIYLNSFNKDGVERKIPILFMNKFFTKDKETGSMKVDNTRKSYDLSTSLMIFGKMAYNYQYMNMIEPKINGLKNLMTNPTPEQGGTEATDRLGRKIKGRIQPYLTKEGLTTETYNLLEDITDAYLYGVKFKDKTLVPGIDTTHVLTKMKNMNSGLKLSFAFVPASGALLAGKIGTIISGSKGIHFTNEQMLAADKMMIFDHKKYKAISRFFDAENDDYVERELQKHRSSIKNKLIRSRTGFAPLRNADTQIVEHILMAMSQNWGVKSDGSIIRFTKKGKEKDIYKDYKSILDLVVIDKDGKASVEGLSKEGYKQFRAAVKAVTSETIGNMNPDDMGAMDTNIYINQMMAFKSWMPALVQEYMGGLRWDQSTQAMRWGRFKAYLNDYRKDLNFTAQEIEDGQLMYAYTTKVLLPNMGRLIVDLTTFGLAPRLGMTRVNEERAKRMFLKWQLENPGLKNKVTFEDFLEIKEAQIKAMLVQLRIIFGVLALAMFLGAKGDDGEPRYYENIFTRNMYKIFSKAGSELTFMWNPTEFIRLVRNPWPLTGLLMQAKSTISNGIDESRDFLVDENSPQDKSPAGYYMTQWMYGGPQLTRFFELFENMKKSQYQVFNTSGN